MPFSPSAAKAVATAGAPPRTEASPPPSSTAAAAAAAGASSPRGSDASAGDCSCAICLERAELEELAILKGCDHTYCVKCILRWAAHRERPTCPQCKQPFEHLFTYRALDGGLHEFPQEESVTLLKRACWFTDYMQVAELGRTVLGADDGSSEWRDYEPYFEEYDDDDEVEAFYMSSAAGRARVVFGNRRWGNSGYVAGGRQVARPSQPARTKGKKGKGGGEAGPAAIGSQPPGSGSKGRRKSAASSLSGPGDDAPGAATCGAAAATAAAAAAADPSEPASAQPEPAAKPAQAMPKASLLTQSLAQAGGAGAAQAAGGAAQAVGAAGVDPASLPVPAPPGADRRSGSSGTSAYGSLGGFDRAAGFSPGTSSGFGGFPHGTSPGAASYGSSPLGSSPGSGLEGGVPGRRARRAMRRAAEDAGGGAGSAPRASARPPPVPQSWEAAAPWKGE